MYKIFFRYAQPKKLVTVTISGEPGEDDALIREHIKIHSAAEMAVLQKYPKKKYDAKLLWDKKERQEATKQCPEWKDKLLKNFMRGAG